MFMSILQARALRRAPAIVAAVLACVQAGSYTAQLHFVPVRESQGARREAAGWYCVYVETVGPASV